MAIICIDAELTGPDPTYHEIIRLATVPLDVSLDPVDPPDSRDWWVQIRWFDRVDAGYMSAHGIDQAALSNNGALYFDTIGNDVATYLDGATLCAFDAHTLWAFLRTEFARSGVTPNVAPHIIDLSTLAFPAVQQTTIADRESDTVATWLGLTRTRAHDPTYNAMTSALMVKEFANRIGLAP